MVAEIIIAVMPALPPGRSRRPRVARPVLVLGAAAAAGGGRGAALAAKTLLRLLSDRNEVEATAAGGGELRAALLGRLAATQPLGGEFRVSLEHAAAQPATRLPILGAWLGAEFVAAAPAAGGRYDQARHAPRPGPPRPPQPKG